MGDDRASEGGVDLFLAFLLCFSAISPIPGIVSGMRTVEDYIGWSSKMTR